MASGRIKGITIEFGGDTTKLEKSLSSVSSAINKTSRNLKDVNSLLKFDSKNTELLSQKQKFLKDQVEQTKNKLEELNRAQKSMDDSGVDKQSEQYLDLRREIIDTEGQLKKYEGKLKSVNQEIKKSEGVFQSLSDKLSGVKEKFAQVGENLTKVGKDLSVKVTAPIIGVGTGAILAWNKYDEAIDGIIKATGATGDEIKSLEKVYKKVYGTMPVEADKLSGAIGELNTQFGFTGDQLEEASKLMIQFENVTGSDVVSSVQFAKQSMEKFGLEADKLPQVLDSVVSSAQKTGMSVDQVFQSMIRGAPQIKSIGLSFEQSALLMGKLEQKGLDANNVLSLLGKGQVTLAKNGKSLSDGLKEIENRLSNASDETEQLSIVSEYFGTKGAVVMLDAIKQGALNFDELANASEESKGILEQTFNDTLDPADKFKVAMNNLELAGATLGGAIQETLAPILDGLATAMQNVAQWFENLPEPIQSTIVIVGLLVAIIGPLIAIAGALASAISFLMSPIGLVIGAITGLIAIGTILIANWESISSTIVGIFEGFKEKTREIFERIGSVISDVWNGINTTISNIVDGVVGFVSGAFEGLKNTVSGIWEGIKEGITGPIEKAKETVKNVIDAIKGFFNFKWSLPKLKMPHISITGKFSLLPPSIPKFSISWYKSGAIFKNPTIIPTLGGLKGVGEYSTGGEVVAPMNELKSIIADVIKQSKPTIINQNYFIVDGKQIAHEIAPQTNIEFSRMQLKGAR